MKLTRFIGSISGLLILTYNSYAFAHTPDNEGPPPGISIADFVTPSTSGQSGLKERISHPSSYGEAGHAAGVETGIPPSGQNGKDFSTTSHCSTWWLSGWHSYKNTWYGSAEIKATSNTYYGSSTDPGSCAKPALIADWLMLDGSLKQYLLGYAFLHIHEEGLNTSSISKADSVWGVAACGGKVRHEARKSGITWGLTSRSGCEQ